MSLRRVFFVALAGVAVTAAIAQASGRQVRFLADSQPRGNGKHFLIDVNPIKFGASSTPTSIAFLLPSGWRLDPRAVSKECTPAQASALRCPRASRIGYGHSVLHIAGYLFPGGQTDGVAYMTAFLGQPAAAGDPASMVLIVQWLGIDRLINAANKYAGTKIKKRVAITGRITRLSSGKYGLEVQFNGFPGGIRIPPAVQRLGVSAAVKRFKLEVGQVRRVRKEVDRVISTPAGPVTIHDHVLVGYHLISRPSSCPSSHLWPWQLRFGFPPTQKRVSGTVKCA